MIICKLFFMEKKMKTLTYLNSFSMVAFFATFHIFFTSLGFSQKTPIIVGETEESYFDGPYILYQGNEAIIYRVNPGMTGSVITQEKFPGAELRQKIIKVFPDGKDFDQNFLKPFDVILFDFQIEDLWDYEQPDKIFAIADIECSFSNTEAILRAGGVIDENYNWIFGSNHLVVNGDMFSRGLDMMALLWLLYKLDFEAQQAGGKVHIIIGNHEAMNLKGDVRYAEKRYIDFAEHIGISYKDLFGKDTELGAWLRTKNTIVKIGRNLIVHGGISPQYIDLGLSPLEVNQIVRRDLGKQTSELDEKSRFVFGSMGPHWYRGMVFARERDNPVFAEDMPPILDFFDAARFIVGHCKGENILKLHDKKVVVIDVNHSRNRRQGISRALLIEKIGDDEILKRINDAGVSEPVSERTP
jgi:hypothetical protein